MELNDVFKNALHYSDYRAHVDELLAAGKTTGNDQSEKLVEFTKLNVQRMNRNDKTTVISEELKEQLASAEATNWLLIGDAWCGDCAQIVPVINKLAEAAGNKADFRIISRDAFPGFIEHYSPAGNRSIPLLIVYGRENGNIHFIWGSRPQPAHNILLHWKANQDHMSKDDFEKELHLWYGRDRGKSIIEEISKGLLQKESLTAQ